ncbi:MAG: hypothetical protein ACRDI2_15935 [Chloroflexota bacterium]
MVTKLDDAWTLADEEQRIRPHVDRLKAFVRRFDPEARFLLQVGRDPEFWELDAYVSPDLADDPDFGYELAGEQTEILLDYDVAIAVIPLTRQEK